MDKNKVIESAAKLIAKGQLEKAAKEFQRALDVDPDDVRILQKLAELYQKMGKKDLAADCFEKVAKTYAAQGFYLKAVALYKQVLKVVERIEVDIRLAELYQQLGLIGDATKEWQNVAAYYEKIGDLKSSLDTLKKLVDLDPDNVAARIRLGEQYARQDNFVEAVSELRRAAAYLQRNARQDDYLRVAERISHLDQGDATLARELAENYMSRGDAKRALAKLQICFKANPRDLQTLQMLGRAFQELGQVSKTVSVLKELARVHLDGQRPDDARRVFLQAQELAPDDADIKTGLRQLQADAPPAPPSRSGSSPGSRPGSSPGRASPGARATASGKFALGAPSQSGTPRAPTSPIAQPTRPVSVQRSSSTGAPQPTPPQGASRAQPPPPPPMSSPGAKRSSSGGARQSQPGLAASAVSIPKLLKETEVYVKYRLHDKALDHLARVFALEPDNTEALEKSKTLALAMQRPADAIDALAKLVRLYSARSDPRADGAKNELRELDAANPALELPAKLGAAFSDDDDDHTSVDVKPIQAPPAASASSSGAARLATQSSSGAAKAAGASSSGAAKPAAANASSGGADRAASTSSSGAAPAPAAGSSSAGRDLFDRAPPSILPANEMEFSDDAVPADAAPPHLEAADISQENAIPGHTLLDARALAPEVVAAAREAAAAREQLDRGDQTTEEAQAVSADPIDDVALSVVDPSLDDHAAITASEDLFAPHLEEAPPAEDHFASDLAEADFYIDAGLHEDARAILEAILLAAPDHPGANSRLAALGELAPDSPAVERVQMAHDARPISVDPDTMAAELAAELASEVADMGLSGDLNDGPLDSAPIDTFSTPPEPEPEGSPRAQLQEAVRREDAQTHYDLGIAYKEMGLLDEAVAEFQLALEFGGGVRKVDCIVILASCAIEQGQPSEAVQVLSKALTEPDVPAAAQRALGYELGQAYEALGERDLAMAQYKAIERSERGFRDTAARIQRLGGTISAPVRPKTAPVAAGSSTSSTPPSKPIAISASASTRPPSAPIAPPAEPLAPASSAIVPPPASDALAPSAENDGPAGASAPAAPNTTPPPPPIDTPAPPVSAPSKSATETDEGTRRNRKIGFI